MKVQSTGGQVNESTQTEAARSAGPATRLNAAPPVFDTSTHRPSNCRADGARQAELLPSINSPSFGVPVYYAGKPYGSLHADVRNQGVYKDDKGMAYIRQCVQIYPVRYDKDNGTWRVHRPDSPTKYAYPVKPDDSGSWHVHGEVGVPGGWRGGASGGTSFGNHAVAQLQQQVQQLQFQRQDLMQQRQILQGQLQQIPGPQHANRSPLELAFQQSMLSTQLTNVNNQLHAIEQQLQQANQQLLQLQNDLQQ